MGLMDWFFGNRSARTPGGAPPHGGSTPPVGARVLARWFDSFFYPGRVESIAGDRCEVHFDDGDRAWVHRANVRQPDIAVGSTVQCRVMAGPAFAPANVQQAAGEKLQVRYANGQEEWTTLSMVRVQRPVVEVGQDPQPIDMPPGGLPEQSSPMVPTGGMMLPGAMPQMGGPPPILDPGTPVNDLNWRNGDRVLARWWDLYWYPGSILAIGTKGFHILYDDGDQRVVPEAHLMPLVVEEGEQIHIRPKTQPQRGYVSATVTRAQSETIDVEFEDGDSETNQRVSRARFWRCPVGVGRFQFDEGERVLACDSDGYSYPAEILTIDGDRVIVQCLDGLERMLTPELIRRFELKIGQAVESRWKGGAQYFPGKITQIEGDRIHVDYADGDKEWTTVRLIRLAPPS